MASQEPRPAGFHPVMDERRYPVRNVMIFSVVAAMGLAMYGGVTVQAVETPLDAAFILIGKDRDAFVQPRSEESFYRFIGRFPLIDAVAETPFDIPGYGVVVSDALSQANSPLELFDAVLFSMGAMAAVTDSAGMIPEFSAAEAGEPLPDQFAGLAPLILAMDTVFLMRQEALGNLTDDELIWFKDNYDLFFYENGIFRFMTGPVEKQAAILKLVSKIDLEKLVRGQRLLIRAVEDAIPVLQAIAKRTPQPPGSGLFERNYRWGRLIIGGMGSNRYTTDAALILDSGGDDIYENNAGGTGRNLVVAALVDLSGDDIYRSNEMGAQGFGFLGNGYLVDLAGNDSYFSGSFSQGGGLVGFGMLRDGAGADRYIGTRNVQGTAVFGAGVLMDESGEDDYRAVEMSQGFGSTLGMGVLYDRSGDDRYTAISEVYGFSQGSGCGCRSYPWLLDFSLYGGVGCLVDDSGHDSYRSGAFSQGASYFMSLGILVDRTGDDHYDGTGGYSHGAGVHLTSGLLLDYEGDDYYRGQWAGNAAGNDRSTGIFLDLAGTDRYSGPGGAGQGYSHKPHGISIFVDAGGDDVYRGKDMSQGYTLPPITPDNWCHVIFFDGGGVDSYSMAERGNNHTWHIQETVAGIDSELPGDAPVTVNTFFPVTTPWTARLGTGDLDPFAGMKAVHQRSGESLNVLIRNLGTGTSVENRAVEEAITWEILGGETESDLLPALAVGLNSEDPRTRAYTVMVLEIHEVNEAEPQILEAFRDSNPYVRKLAIRCAGSLKLSDAAPVLEKLIGYEPDPWCRGQAVRALGRIAEPSSEKILVNALNDSSEFVRMMAAYALSKYESDTVKTALKSRLKTAGPYVQKAAGEALLRLGDRAGLIPMIDYLNYWALDTSSENYGSNIGATLMEYTNVDFSRDHGKWTAWAEEHGESFDLDANKQARSEWLEAVKAKRRGDENDAINAYEQALIKNPNYLKAKTDYAAMLNGKAWGMVTSPSADGDIAAGLELARRCVELDPNPMYRDTLAEALFQNGLIKEAAEIQIAVVEAEPDVAEYRMRLEKIRKVLGDKTPAEDPER